MSGAVCGLRIYTEQTDFSTHKQDLFQFFSAVDLKSKLATDAEMN